MRSIVEVLRPSETPLDRLHYDAFALYDVRLTAEDFGKFPRILRRYTLSHLWYLTRLRRRRRRFVRLGRELALRWRKPTLVEKKRDGFAIVVGPLSDTNGLGRAARYELDKLRMEYARLEEIDIRHTTPELIQKRIDAGELTPPDILIILAQPDNYKLILPLFEPDFLARAWRIGQLVWEMQYCPDEWAFLRDILHEFWSPSRFSAESIASGLRLPYEVRPHPVNVPDVPPMDRDRFGVTCNDFLGLAIMDLRACPDRKNPLTHVETWQRAFGRDPTCKLLLKVRFSKRTQVVRRELLELIGDYPNITMVEDVFSDQEISAFQKMGNVFLSLHRSEGYGLNIKEALIIGLPVVATDWSAPAEYLSNHANAYRLRCVQIPCRDYLRTYAHSRSLRWAEPDMLQAAVMLREIHKQFKLKEFARLNAPHSC